MFDELARLSGKPPLYTPSTNRFWDDEHISRFVLDSHLNPEADEASRRPEFMDESAAWIASLAPPSEFPRLLDLGCGPGLYASRFHAAGYRVTGIDFSRRSIEYAKEQAAARGDAIEYFYRDYLTIDYDGCFDLVVLLYCDFGALPAADRAVLLSKVHAALRPGGTFILDVFTPVEHVGKPETRDWHYHRDGGFWSGQPHLCLDSFFRYDEDGTVLSQTIVVGKNQTDCYNIWEHCFTAAGLLSEAGAAGFAQHRLFADVRGRPFDEQGNVMCAVFTK